MGTDVIGQSKSDLHDCANEQLEVYADSLDNLLLACQPLQVLHISDSLFQKYSNPNCSVMVRMKAASASAYELLFDFEPAVKIYNDLLKTAVKNQFTEEEIAVRLSLARVYEAISRPEFCIQNLKEAKKLIDAHGLTEQLSRYYVRYASYQRLYKDKAVAREYATKAVKLGKEHGVARSVADGNLILGLVTEDFEESIQYFQQVSTLFFELGDNNGGMFQQMNIARRYLRIGGYDKALEILNNADAYTKEITNNDKVYYEFKMEIAKTRADVFERIGDKDNLITSLKNYNEYSDLFGFMVNQEHINQLLLENAISQEQEKTEAAIKLNGLLYLGLLCLSGIIIILSRLYWLNASKNNKIQEQTQTITKQYGELESLYNYQSTLLREVHHRIKNNLQLIISLVTLQNAKISNDVNSGILDMLCHRINSIALIHEQLYISKVFDKVNVELYIKDLLKKFILLISEKKFDFEHKINDIHLNLETITPLGLIWSELISNSLKYNLNRGGLKIYIDLVKKGDVYFMHYYDNGVGYPGGQFIANQSGMGFTIIHILSMQLLTKLNTYNSNGAHFTLEFKEKMISPL